MAIRASIVLAIIVAAMSDCLGTSGATAITLHSKRRNISVSVTAPSGWHGPGYGAWPSYDSFSWSHGEDSAACYLSIRFDPYSDEPGDRHSADDIAIHWNTTPLAKIREQLKREFQRPQVERLTTLTVAGEPVRIHGVYNADGDAYFAEIVRAGTVIFIELRSPSRRELERHRQMFLSFVNSLHIST